MPKHAVPHIPFDRMKCPSEGCNETGTVPGIKRHVAAVHKGETHKFPPTRTAVGLAKYFDDHREDDGYCEPAEKLIADLGIEVAPEASLEEVAEKILARKR